MNEITASASLRRRLMAYSAGHSTVLDVIGLMLCALVVHGFYVLYIDPLAGDSMRTAAATATVPERTLAVILKDIEQEICIVLGLWSAWLLAFRYRLFENEGYLLDMDFLDLGKVTEYSQPVLTGLQRKVDDASARVPGSLLLSSTGLALDRIRLNGAFHEANEVAAEACDLHLEMLHSKLAINRYVLWAIPSIGFLGTVRGIGEALTRAGEAMSGDISGVAASLGIAFNSTFVALFVSLVLMLFSSMLQGREERLAANCKHFVSSQLIARLSALAKSSGAGDSASPGQPPSIEESPV